MPFANLPVGHFQGGAHITGEAGDGLDLVSVFNACKAYIDATVLAPGTRGVIVAKAASTANLDLDGAETVDAIACGTGDVVFAKNQTDPKENGPYVVAAGAWMRHLGLAAGESACGCVVHVDQGTLSANHTFICTTVLGSDVVGTNNLVFTDLNSVLGVATAVNGVAAGYKVARGISTTVSASDTVVTGLATVVAVVASLEDDPVDGCMHANASIGDQAGSPAAGSIYLKTWKSTDGDATLIAATTFTKKVAWVAVGT